MRGRIALFVVFAGLLGLVSCDGDDGGETFTIAFLRAVPAEDHEPLLRELRDAGFVVGENLTLLPDDPLGETYPDPEAAKRKVAEWIDEGVDFIYAFSSSGAQAAAEVTSEVPILFLVNDPTAVGLVDDEDAPSGNLTGATFRVPADRTVDLASRVIPGLEHLGILVSEGDPAAPPARDAALDAAEEAGLDLTVEMFAGEDDVERSIGVLAEAGVAAIHVVNAPTAVRLFPVIEPVATAAGIPLIANTDFAEGAVVILTPDTDELLAQLGRQGARILGGASPSEVPVEDPRQFRVILDAGKAAELGLPPFTDDLSRQADEVVR